MNLNPNTNLDSAVKEVRRIGAKDINAGKHHRQTGGKPLHNVVRVVHDCGDDDARESLRLKKTQGHHIQEDRNPGVRVVSGEESFLADSRQVLRHRIQTAEEASGETQLDALDPDVALRFPLQHHFKEDSSESTRQRADDDADEPQERILRRRGRLHGGALAAQLDETNAGNNDDQGNPLAERQMLVEEEYREERCRQNLHLVGDGVDGRVQIRDRNETSCQREAIPPYRRLFWIAYRKAGTNRRSVRRHLMNTS